MKCLVLSDIHANWPVLESVLAVEPDADQILCPGDLVNHGWPRQIDGTRFKNPCGTG